MNKILKIFLVFVALTACNKQDAVKKETFEQHPLRVLTREGGYDLTVELAATDTQKAQGLMFRKQMGPDSGMIFVYDKPQKISMWMKNTYIPLDMLFISQDRKIMDIVSNTEPLSEKIITTEEPAIAVIELNAGTVKRLGIEIGDTVETSAIP